MPLFGKRLKLTDVAPSPDLVLQRRRAKVLVIDDDENAFPIKLLQKEGYSIEYWPEVSDLRRLEEGDFDIIFLDIQGVAGNLGEADGIGVLKAIKNTNPNQIVVAFSAHSYDLSKMAFWKEADDGLKKPVEFLTAKETIDRMLGRLTVLHFWGAIRSILHRENVSGKNVDRLEHELAKAIKGGKNPNFESLFDHLVRNEDAQKALATLAGRLMLFAVAGT